MEYYQHTFTASDPLPPTWAASEFEECRFAGLTLTGADFRKSRFINCRFDDCFLSKAVLSGTQLATVLFRNCEMTHLNFGDSDAFGFAIRAENCRMDHNTFLRRNLSKARFDECSLTSAHFIGCNLTDAVFSSCNLERAVFEENQLVRTDFISSFHLRMDPDVNTFKKTRVSLYQLPGLLAKYDLSVSE